METHQEVVKLPEGLDQLLTVDQMAHVLQVDRATVFRMLKEGMPAYRFSPRVVRFDRGEVLEWYRIRCFTADSSSGAAA